MTTVRELISQVSFWPELRLRWFHTFVHWMAHLSDLPHLDLEVSLHHKLLDLCTLVVPCHWAWDSAEQTLLQYADIAFHSTAWIQRSLFHSLLYELEHVLAQDWFHRCLAFNLRDGTYERRRSVFCRADGRLWQSLCQASKNGGGGQIIRSPHYPKGTEEAFALIGFGLGKDGSLISMIAKLTLRQEDQLNQIHLNKSFIFFVQTGKGSILPLMLKTFLGGWVQPLLHECSSVG